MLVEPLFVHAKQIPDQTAIIDDRGKTSYSQLGAMAAGLGMYLGMTTQAPRVGVLLPASTAFVASFYGTLLAGKTVVPINFLLGDREIAHIIADSGIDTVLSAPPLAGRLKDLPVKVIDLTQLPSPGGFAIQPRIPAKSADEIAVLMYTSGTSGLPKGVCLSYGNLQSDVDAAIIAARLVDQHKFLGVVPLFHSFGMTAMMIAPIQLAAPVIYLARFSPVATLNALREHRASLFFGVPSMYAAMFRLKDAKPEDFTSIYAMLSGGEPLPATLREAFLQRFGVPLLEGYGLTETSPVISLNTPHVSRPGSVGKLIPGAVARIVDDSGEDLPVGQTGEIWLGGPMIMKGYHNLPQETAEAVTPDGFFKTGDLGKFDADGFLYITGRKKEMIIIAGEKAYPREIEETLLAHEGVAEVAVLGKKDPSRGEVIVAFIIAKPEHTLTVDELRDFCRGQGLAQWKIPREIHIVPDLPRSPTGKVLRRALAEKLAN